MVAVHDCVGRVKPANKAQVGIMQTPRPSKPSPRVCPPRGERPVLPLADPIAIASGLFTRLEGALRLDCSDWHSFCLTMPMRECVGCIFHSKKGTNVFAYASHSFAPQSRPVRMRIHAQNVTMNSRIRALLHRKGRFSVMIEGGVKC